MVGPTGSGKSDLALTIAERFGGEIVNCDSVQLYRHMDIGTAKTPPDERRGIPHHLIDVLDPDEHFTAGDYARAARQVVNGIAARAAGGEVLITADHGNCERMFDPGTGQPHTAHTLNRVPFVYVGRPAAMAPGGALQDIAPTMLALMGLPQPPEMTGKPLLELRKR